MANIEIRPTQIPTFPVAVPSSAELIAKAVELNLQKEELQQKKIQNLIDVVTTISDMRIRREEIEEKRKQAEAALQFKTESDKRGTERLKMAQEIFPLQKQILERAAAGIPRPTIEGERMASNLENAESTIDRILSEIEKGPQIAGRSFNLISRKGLDKLGIGSELIADIENVGDLIANLRTGAQRGEPEVARIAKFSTPRGLTSLEDNKKIMRNIKTQLSILRMRISAGRVKGLNILPLTPSINIGPTSIQPQQQQLPPIEEMFE